MFQKYSEAEIQEGLAKMLCGMSTNPFKEDWNSIPEWRREQFRKNAGFIISYLKSMAAWTNG